MAPKMALTKPLIPLLALLSLLTPASAFIGFGIPMYDPVCAFACRDSISSAPLTCTSSHHGPSGGHGSHGGATTPECRASDSSFLSTLAWCLKQKCESYEIPDWRLEQYWVQRTTGDPEVMAKWNYGEALRGAEEPKVVWNKTRDEVLNYTAVVDEETWTLQRKTLESFRHAETMHSQYGIITLVVGFGLPLLLSFLAQAPIISSIFEKAKPYLVYPAIIGSYHINPLTHYLGNSPTAGQFLFIIFYSIFNLITSSVSYRTTYPNTWFPARWEELAAYIENRTGVLAFALAPLVLLFAGRNNVLLYLTNWSYSTYILLHRWIARIFTIQVVVHSLVAFASHVKKGTHATEVKELYWIWGIVATVACCIMVVVSVLFFRRLSYEVFLIFHILLSVFVIVGSWFHVEYLFEKRWGYEFWMYACFAVWALDRLIRWGRIVKAGLGLKGVVTEVAEGIVRIDIERVEYAAGHGGHVYAYLPTLRWYAPWENHPFSFIPASSFAPTTKISNSPVNQLSVLPEKSAVAVESNPVRPDLSTPASTSSSTDIEKFASPPSQSSTNPPPKHSTGITLYIRRESGITKNLKAGIIPIFLEGPYRAPTSSLLLTSRLIVIAGGIGITGALPLATHGSHSNVKLYWSVRQGSQGLVDDLAPALARLREKEVKVGSRFDVEEVLGVECETSGKVGVLVCGPGGLCDEVRRVVVALGRKGKRVEFEVEAYSW